MSEFIPSYTITEFRKLKAPELKRLKSCEVTSDGEYLFTFVNGYTEPSGYLRNHTANLCQTANAVGGETLEQILESKCAPV
jgi:hypothetical protein